MLCVMQLFLLPIVTLQSCGLEAQERAMGTVVFGITLSAATCINVAALVMLTI
jgi:hypothetical protein